MAFKATPIFVCANPTKNSFSQFDFQDSFLGFNQKNSCSELHFNLRPGFPKWECLAVVNQRAVIHTDDDKPLLSPTDEVEVVVEVDQTLISPPKNFDRDLSCLPRPLTAKDFVSSPTDGSKVRVAHQGSRGAYSEAAALKAYPKCETVPCNHFEAVFKAVDLWMVEKAVLPIENSVGGSIHRNYDLLLRHRLHIVGEVKLVVNHCLLALPGVKKEELKKVLSHPQALDQCKKRLDALGVDRLSAADTGSAAQIAASDGLRDQGAVASPHAAEIYGLKVLEERIQDDLDNITRFLVLAREPLISGTDRPYKTSIVFTLEEGPGVLFKALAVFAMRDITLMKIESRPQTNPVRIVDQGNKETAKYFDYLFFVDLEASMAEPRTQNALKNLQEYARFIRVLGCYPINSC